MACWDTVLSPEDLLNTVNIEDEDRFETNNDQDQREEAQMNLTLNEPSKWRLCDGVGSVSLMLWQFSLLVFEWYSMKCVSISVEVLAVWWSWVTDFLIHTINMAHVGSRSPWNYPPQCYLRPASVSPTTVKWEWMVEGRTPKKSQMPRHLINDAHEWMNEISAVPIY